MEIAETMVFATGLVALINPLACLPLYQGLVTGYHHSVQNRIAVSSGLVALIFMLVVVWCGDALLAALRIEVAAMQAAGGLIILRIAIDMMTPHDKSMPLDERGEADQEPWNIVAVVPIAIPMTVGGGTFAYIAAATTQAQGVSDFVSLSGACIAVATVIGMTYYFARPIMNTLGTIGARIIVRLAGVILMAIALQLMAAGLRGLMPGLATP